MNKTEYIDDAKVMSKGQITIPKNVRNALGVDVGDRVTFIVDGNNVRVVNSAIYALLKIQKEMKGVSKKANLNNEDDVINWVMESRKKVSN